MEIPSSLPEQAPFDRAALASAVADIGLTEQAERIAYEVAQFGIRLKPTDEPTGSRIGGGALLPAGVNWPRNAEGQALSFLAALRLAELPNNGVLPADGWLLFFADIRDHGGWWIESPENVEGAPTRVLYVPAGVELLTAESPDPSLHVLVCQHVLGVRQLSLPTDHETPQWLGLDGDAVDVYDEIAGILRYGNEALDFTRGTHWVLGALVNVQGHPVKEDTVLLLHLSFDEKLDFLYLDDGAIQFRIPAAALAAAEWSAVYAESDSC